MSEVITPVIKVDVGESQQTVKGLKKEISDLKDRILNLTKGSDEYNKAVSQLQANQRKLNEVMALSKKEAVALDGSYDALTHQMALLRKEWKATNDEAKRNELGKQIDAINDQLKELDGSIGNFQRNVGNYSSALDGVGDSAKKAGKDVVAASAAPKDFGTAMREMNESIEPSKQKFEAVGNIASGLAGGFAAAQGAMALLGVESEGFEKTMIKVQSAMAIAQGVSGMKGLVEGVGKAKVAFAGLGDKIKAVSKTMGAAGWIAVIVAVTTAIITLVSWIKKSKNETDKLTLSLEEQKNMNDKLGQSIGEAIAEYKLFQKEYSKLNSAKEKKQWIEENASAFEKLGLNIQSVNDADDAFIKKTPQVVTALRARAKAEALTQLYKEAIIESEKKKAAYKPYIPEESVQGSATNAAKGIYPEALRGFEDYYGVADGYYQGGTIAYMRNKGVTEEMLLNAPIVAQRKKEAFAEFDTNVTLYEEMMNTANEEALAAERAAGLFSSSSSSSTSSSKPKKEIKIEVATDVKAEIEDLENLYRRKIELAETASFDQKKIDEEVYKLALEREEAILDAIVYGKEEALRLREEAQKKEIDLQNQISKEKNAAKKKQLQQELKETQDLIKKYVLIESELFEAKADQEVVIEQVKYDELKRLRQLNLEEEAKAIEDAEKLYQESLRNASSTYGTVEKKERGWFGKFVGSIFGVDAMDENNQAKAQQENDSNYYAAAYEAEQNFLNQKLALKQKALEDERNTEDEKIDYLKEIADIEIAIQQSKYAEEERLRQEKVKKEKETQNKIKAIYGSSLQATSDLLNGIADAYESSAKREDESEAEQEKSAKKVKNLRIAAATIDMLQGATTAFSSAMQLGPIAGPIVGGVNAAAVVAMGIANINKIKNTNTDGSDVGGTGAATPSMGSYTNDTPYSYTRQLTGASETDSLNQDTRVYILESDIQASNKKVQIRESESSF